MHPNKIRHRAGSCSDRQVVERTARQVAIALLTRREHSRQELQRKLLARGLPQDEVAGALAELADDGWQDDTRFAETLTRVRAEAGYGPAHIRAELAMHALGEDRVAAALAPFEGTWVDRARELAQRRFEAPMVPDRAFERRVLAFLLRRGFGHAAARSALDRSACRS